MSLKRLIIFLVIATAIFVGGFFLLQNQKQEILETKEVELIDSKKQKKPVQEKPKENLMDLIPEGVLLDVPFAAQAPFGNWDNPVFQDGCEEASIILAMRWVEGKEITKQEMQQEIINISEFEQENYGEYRDRSTKDTAQLIKDYYNYQKIEARFNITIEDIKLELRKGNLVITPMDGRALSNPFYTPPGPERHMLVIKGYDDQKKEFITNDVGTRHGESYRYQENVFYQAIRDYETGYHKPILELRKTMIVVEWPYKACIRNNCFNVELADSPQERSKGLMFRQGMDLNRGMFFVFEEKARHSFWMKNTLIPLDIIWMDENYKVVYIKNNFQPCIEENCETVRPTKKAKYVLEVNGGLAERIGIKTGERFDFNF